jgi:aminopeptidase N
MLYELYEDADGKILNNADDKRPVVFNEYNNSMDQFDYRVYPKGSWILHMLRCQLGPDLFRECIKEYLQQHALASVVTDDLRQIIEKKSGQPMDRFFSQWLYHGGVPQLQVSYEWEPESRIAKVSIKQTQEVNDQIVLFELPTKIRFVVNNQKIDRPITISKAGEDFYFQLDKQPTIVRFDPDYSVLAKVNFDKSDDLIFEDLKNADDLVGRLIACRQLAERRSEESVNALAAVLDSDSFHGVRNAAAWSLAKIGTPKAQEALRQSWQKQTDARVRSVVVFQMLKGFDPATSAAADEILRIERNPAVAAHALEAIGLYNSQEHHNKLVEYLDKPVFDDLYALAAINGIEKSGDFELMRPLQEALQKNSKSWLPHTTGNALRAIAKLTSTQDNKREVRDLIAVYLNSPRKQIQEAAIDALGDLRDPSAIALLAPLSESTDTDIQSRAKTARKAIQNSTAALPEEFSKLREELQKLREDTKTLQEKIDTLQSKEDAAKNASP